MQVQFYLLNPDEPAQLPALLLQTCRLCAELYRANQRVFVYCPNQQDAERLDEVLWQFDPDSFVPHNLAGEGPPRGAPIEISWQMPKTSRNVLVNWTSEVPPFANRYSKVIEFVPADEAGKIAARQKFKFYRQLGVTPETVQAS